MKNYFGSVSTVGSLAFNAAKLGRTRIKEDAQEYHAADELIRHTFDSFVIRACQVVSNPDEITKAKASDTDTLSRSKILSSIVDKLVDRYFDNIDSLKVQFGVGSNNAALFLRDVTLFMELRDAIKFGDIGRIEEVL
ncbi:hypothetical protein BGX21_007713, partial [Mortierella sp. AD011]